jgi:hypothetical protein
MRLKLVYPGTRYDLEPSSTKYKCLAEFFSRNAFILSRFLGRWTAEIYSMNRI